jgi:hypothetical protein
MRASGVVLGGIVFLFSALGPGVNAGPMTPPATWQPSYWDEALQGIESMRKHGDRQGAENLCADAIPYVEQQAIRALKDYADLLDSQRAGSGAEMRAKAEKLADAKERQRHATKPGNTPLGFVPWHELTRYSDALLEAHRDSDAQAIRELAAAYKYTQEVYVRRTILMRQGKDPRGEC